MKHNGHNIILDEDITMTGDLSGEKLSEIIREQRSEIEKLKSNLKWIYKYGGVGGSGGSGGGGGGASGFVLYAELGSVQLNNQSVAYNGEGNYELYIKITRPNGASFKVTYTYDVVNSSGVTSQASTTVTLDVSNDYSYTRTINLNCNGRITVKAVDSIYSETKSAFTDYIIESYNITSQLVDNTGTAYGSSEIFMETAAEKGLRLRVNYNIAIASSGNNTCKFVFNKGSQALTETVTLNGTSGYHDFDIGADYLELTEANSGYYSATAIVNLDLEGQLTDPIEMITSFNLVPQQLFLLVEPSTGSIYTEPNDDEESRYTYGAGFITFNLRPYLGSYTNGTAVIKYRVINSAGDITNDNTGDGIQTRLGTQTSVTIFSTSIGHNEIQFKVSAMGAEYPSTTGDNITEDGYIRYHFYVKATGAAINWYDASVLSSGYFNYYRLDDVTTSFNSFKTLAGGNIYQQTSNKGNVSISPLTVPTDTTSTAYDTNIAIGIQYNEVNNEDDVILSGTYNGQQSFSITQNKITIGTADSGISFNYFLPKIRNYNKSQSGNYHLVNLVSRRVQRINNYNYYEVLIYIDGFLEGGNETYVSSPMLVDNLILGQTNCFVNTLEVSYLVSTNQPLDNAICQYFLKYKNTILQANIDGDEIELLNRCAEFTLDGNDVFCTNPSTIENIAHVLNVPTLVLEMSQDRKAIIDASYGENDEINPIEVSVKWAPAKGNLAELQFPASFNNAYFTIQIQGSSTKSYKCKNFTLSLNNRNTGEEAGHYVFSPNYKSLTCAVTTEQIREAQKTFLPEESFTLKADVVDSSHSNNTSIGKFVNDITQAFDTTTYTQSNNSLSGYVKNCLDGFPCVVYLCIPRVESGITTKYYYYQGVYNFNLGRESFYNLGYKDSSVFCDNSGNPLLPEAGDGWSFYRVEAAQDYSIKPGIVVAEIQGNSPFFDFSQYDESILYKSLTAFDKNQETYMFDDFVAGTGITDAMAKNTIQTMVKQVSKAGGYLFNYIRKKFGDDAATNFGYVEGYNAVDGNNVPTNQVPNYKKHFKKKQVNNDQVFEVDETITEADGRVDDVRDLIIGNNGDNPMFDFRSLCEYYTICMAFGLVDSVQKNMNIKTWNASTAIGAKPAKFYAAFYDMDTCLGINNAGQDVSYFAFSDYWSYDDSNVDSEGTVTPSSVIIYRDFSPKSNAAGGTNAADYYDTPSSYLFAVAKYARLIKDAISVDGVITGSDATQDYPQELWAKWRAGATDERDNTIGCLRSAETFMNNYFSNNLGKVGALMVNLNYRNKYLVQPGNGDESVSTLGFSHLNFVKFNGTRIAKATDWLDGRFHILDAYFNLPKSTSSFMYYDTNGDYVAVPVTGGNEGINYLPEPVYETNTYNLEGNSDIFILQDIFAGQNGVNQTAGILNINVKAKEFSPLIINTANTGTRFLLGGKDNLYHIRVPLSGNQTYSFYGSGAWTYLDSINSFNFKTLNVSSKYLETLSGSSSTNAMTLGTINMPSLKTLELTSPNYTGTLSIDGENYPNLGSVNVSNTGINLDITNSTITTVNISNMRNSSVSIIGCPNLQNVTFGAGGTGTTSTTLTNCIISPMSNTQLVNTVTINNSKIKELTLTNTTFTNNRTHLKIVGDESLTTLNISGISILEVSNCSSLKNIFITDPETPTGEGNPNGDYLTQILCNSCGNSSISFRVGSAEGAEDVIDLRRYTHLTTVKFSNILGFTDCKLPANVGLSSSAFSGSSGMRTLSGENILLNGTSIFSGCVAYTMKTAEGTYTDFKLSSTLTSLASMFNSGRGGSINRDAANHFINNIVGDNASRITNISGMFSVQNISYTQADLQFDLGSGTPKRYIDLSKFTNVTDVSSAFSWTSISALHPKMFSFGSNVSSISFGSFCTGGSRTYYAPIDIFKDIINKINILWNTSWPSEQYQYTMCIVNSSGNTRTDTIPLKDLLHPSSKNPSKITRLGGFTLATNQTWDLTDAFSYGWDALTRIDGFLYNDHARLMNCNKIFVNGANTGPANLKLLYECFRVNNSNDPINLASFLNWSRFVASNSNDPISERSSMWGSSTGGCFNMTKYIPTKAEFNTLVRTLINSGANATSLTGISNIFKNCTVFISNAGEATLSLAATTKNNNIKAMNSTFRNFKMISTSGEAITAENLSGMMAADPEYITFADNLFNYVPNVQSFNRTFMNIKLNKSLPYNFFGLRYASDTGNVYYVKELDEHDEEVYSLGKRIYYNYNKRINNLSYCFANVSWNGSGDVSAKYFNDDPLSLPANRFIVQSSGTVYTDGDMQYYRKVITDIYDPETGEKTGEEISYAVQGKIGTNDEITDALNLNGAKEDDAFTVTLKNSSGNNFDTRFTNYPISEECRDKLFIAPDIFYGCATGANVTYCFANTSDSVDECLEGIIPEHLMKECKTSALTGLFQNLNIVPRFLKQQGTEGESIEIAKIYHFIPENFTTCTDLAGAFNFHIRLPQAAREDNSGVTRYNKYYLLLSNSIPRSTTSLKNAFTGAYYDSSSGGQFHDSVNNTWINTHNYDYNIRFNIMYNVDSETDGIDMDHFTVLNVDEIVTAPLAMICYGNLFNENYLLNNAKKTEDTYIMRAFNWTNENIVSRNLKLPRATGTWETKYVIYWGGGSMDLPIWSNQIESIDTSRAAYNSMRNGSTRKLVVVNPS